MSSLPVSLVEKEADRVERLALRFATRHIEKEPSNIVDFPIFAARWLPNGKALVAGGGGRKGTGISSGVV